MQIIVTSLKIIMSGYTRSESKGHVQEYRDKIRDEIGGDKFDGMDAKELEEYLVG